MLVITRGYSPSCWMLQLPNQAWPRHDLRVPPRRPLKVCRTCFNTYQVISQARNLCMEISWTFSGNIITCNGSPGFMEDITTGNGFINQLISRPSPCICMGMHWDLYPTVQFLRKMMINHNTPWYSVVPHFHTNPQDKYLKRAGSIRKSDVQAFCLRYSNVTMGNGHFW